MIKNGIKPNTSFVGELHKYNRVLCTDQLSGKGNTVHFLAHAGPSFGFACGHCSCSYVRHHYLCLAFPVGMI